MTEWLLGRVNYSYCIGIVIRHYIVYALNEQELFPFIPSLICGVGGTEQHGWVLKHWFCLGDFFSYSTGREGN